MPPLHIAGQRPPWPVCAQARLARSKIPIPSCLSPIVQLYPTPTTLPPPSPPHKIRHPKRHPPSPRAGSNPHRRPHPRCSPPRFRALALLRRLLLLRVDAVLMQASEKPSQVRSWTRRFRPLPSLIAVGTRITPRPPQSGRIEGARLGADAVRYSFIVAHFHRANSLPVSPAHSLVPPIADGAGRGNLRSFFQHFEQQFRRHTG